MSTLSTFNHREIEAKYSTLWAQNKLYQTPKIEIDDKKKYILDMFPYPSGAGLHVGHPRGYVATDILSRFYRSNGYKVLHPMGWDAFGLPAEQYAFKTGEHPNISTQRNIQTFKKQLNLLGLSYDWDREIDTTDENYYKWTQWIFLQLFDKGLAFESQTAVNWCGELGTILANEEVIGGRSERGNYPVTKQAIKQWTLKITDYAERLNKDLELLPNWPNKIRLMQANWIGQSEGLVFSSPVKDMDLVLETFSAHFEAYCADTFVVIAPDHPLLPKLIKGVPNEQEILDFCQRLSHRKGQEIATEKEVEGIFTGRYTIDPIGNGHLPIWVASFAIASYGTGIIKCSAHDQRDFDFAKKYNIPLKTVLYPADAKLREQVEKQEICFSDMKSGILSEPLEFVGQIAGENREKIMNSCVQKNLAKIQTAYKLRDWIFSRQRYWGEPIPIVFEVDDSGNKISKAIALDDSELPLKLPKVDDFRQIAVDKTGKPEPILERFPDWVNVTGYYLPNGKVKIIDKKESEQNQQKSLELDKIKDKNTELKQEKLENQEQEQNKTDKEIPKIELKKFVRETNTMPQWAGSSWYYLRFMDNLNESSFYDMEKLWGQVDIYVGGAEHAVLHLLYARFWHKVLFDLGLVSHKEPFDKLINQGLIMAPDGQKMSKSLGNVVNPDDVISEFGADTLRIFEMFLAPFEQTVAWNDTAIIGVKRFLDKVWNLQERLYLDNEEWQNKGLTGDTTIMFGPKTENLIEIELNKLIKKITFDIENIKFNTCVSEFMKFVNFVEKTGAVLFPQMLKFVILLAPFAPFLCEEIYANLVNIFAKVGYPGIGFEESYKSGKFLFEPKTSVHLESWPTVNLEVNLEKESTILSVQINGKVRGTIEINEENEGKNEEEIKKIVLELEFVKKYLDNKTLKKFIYIPKKAINLVVV